MCDTTEVQALEKISTEVGDAQIKITLSSQCIKAQAFLVDKLRKQSERQKEVCSFISSNNLKLQTEIRQAEIEIKSLMLAKETIKNANVELKKECLLIKERKYEIEERVREGEKKYEDLWLQAKSRYESIPHVQKLLLNQNNIENLKENIQMLKEKSDSLAKDIEIKKKFINDMDRRRIVELAQYLVVELPKGIKMVQEKTKAIKELTKNIDEIVKTKEDKGKISKIATARETAEKKMENEIENTKKVAEDGWSSFGCDNPPDSIMMPQICLIQSDFDSLSAKLDKIKIKKTDMFNVPPAKRIGPMEPDMAIQTKKTKKEDDFSIYMDTVKNDEFRGDSEMKKESFSKRKLINILEDIKLDKNDAYEMVSKVNPDKLKGVQHIGTDNSGKKQACNDDKKEQEHEDIEVIDLTNRSENNLLVPPTQFLDYGEDNYFSSSQQQVEVIVHMSMTDSTGKGSPDIRNSQENKKRVCFDVPMTIQEINDDNNVIEEPQTKVSETSVVTKETEAFNDTIESQVDISLISDETYTQMKNMILKKHHLDLSPQFVYAKNNALQMTNNSEGNVVTSKFFRNTPKDTVVEKEDKPDDTESQKDEAKLVTQNKNDEPNIEQDEVVVSSPKARRPERAVTGLLFNHGAQGIPDSLNVSISTTGFEEGDSDFPHGIDSSLLLSPKADFPMTNNASDNPEILSQEVPNFLSGLRKTGFSFFGQPTGDSKASTSEQNQNNFNFNFGGDDKKGRGGLFSMFR